MLQQIIAYGLLILAIFFLVKRYLLKPKKKGKNCGKDCNC